LMTTTGETVYGRPLLGS